MTDSIDFRFPSEVDEWLDEASGLAPAARRQAESFAAQWRTALGYELLGDLERKRVALENHYKANVESINSGRSETATLVHRILTGQVTGAEALREAARLHGAHQESVNVQARLANAEERWLESAQRDPEELLAEQRERFPSAGWTRRMTADYLSGREPSPFVRRGNR